VAFDIDANGILNVSARDKATGKEQKIRIEASGGLTEQEIKKMVTDAEAHADEDRTRREAIDTKNRGESRAYETEKQLKELGDKIDPESRARVESALERLKKAVGGSDLDEIKAADEALTSVWGDVSGKLYADAAKAGGGEKPGPSDSGKGDGGDGGAVDADYEVVK
jgi:molecular chaperone DnaK